MPYGRPPLLLIPCLFYGNSASRLITTPQLGDQTRGAPAGVRGQVLVVGSSGHHQQPDTVWPTTTLKPHTSTEDEQRDQIHKAVTFLDTPRRQPRPVRTYHRTTEA